jgi:sialic acid synthase SpsE
MIITEVGLNHLGDVSYAKFYLKKIVKNKIDGISFQIKKKNFYDNYQNFFKKNDKNFYKNFREKNVYDFFFKKKRFTDLQLPERFYHYAKKICVKNKKSFGVAIGDENKLDFFINKIKVDFIKILSEDFYNNKLLNKILKSDVKNIFLSTGNIPINSIKKKIQSIKPKYLKRLTLIYTNFDIYQKKKY